MGSYVDFRGKMFIPQEKLPEFNKRVITILHQGGMMGVEQVELYGKRIALLTPPEPDEDGEVVCRYNYFEDDSWDNIYYDTKTGRFVSRDIGCLQYCEVVCAVYALYELYAGGTAYRDGEVFDKEPHIGWLNYLFNERFSAGSGKSVERIPTTLFVGYKGFSDDDRAAFWKPCGDVCFSPEMQEWLEELRAELLAIRSSTDRPLGNRTILEALMGTLDRAKEYGHLYAFQEMFYDFVVRPDDRDRQAAVALFQRLSAEGMAELPSAGNGGWFDWQKKRFYPARQRLKRYLAVMGNLKLRWKNFGF